VPQRADCSLGRREIDTTPGKERGGMWDWNWAWVSLEVAISRRPGKDFSVQAARPSPASPLGQCW